MTRPLALLSFFGVAARSAAQDATSADVTVLPPTPRVASWSISTSSPASRSSSRRNSGFG